jgi:hypothetical protein
MPHFFIEISELAEPFASHEEVDLRERIGEAIESQGLGSITGSGSGFGAIDLSIEAPDIDGIEARLAEVVRGFVPSERFTIRRIEEPDEREEDREWLRSLGEEIGPASCKRAGCDRLRIAMSVYCRRHHFEQVWGRPPSREETA